MLTTESDQPWDRKNGLFLQRAEVLTICDKASSGNRVFADVTKVKRRSLAWTLSRYAWCPKQREGGRTRTAVMADAGPACARRRTPRAPPALPAPRGREEPLSVASGGLAPDTLVPDFRTVRQHPACSGTPSVVTGYSSLEATTAGNADAPR